MPWYGWFPWILFVVTLAGFIIYMVMKRPKTSAELRATLQRMDREYREMKSKLEVEKVARQKAEGERAAAELSKLELEHSEKLKALEGKEQDDFERAKVDPESGVNFINDLLRDNDTSDSTS